MDVKTKLEYEPIFFAEDKLSKNRIKKLYDKGIITIEDFINADLENIVKSPYILIQYQAFKQILKHKYLNSILVNDVLLEQETDIWNVQYYLKKLGFAFSPTNENLLLPDFEIKRSSLANASFKVIEIIKEINSYVIANQPKVLSEFYIDYYNKNMIKNQIEGNDSEVIDELKQQLVELLDLRNKLDVKIEKINELVNSLEGRKSIHGK